MKKKWRIKELEEERYPVNAILDFVNSTELKPEEWKLLSLKNPFTGKGMIVLFYYSETSL